MFRKTTFAPWLIAALLLGLFAPIHANATELVIYDDQLASGWQDWSWGSTIDFANTSPVQAGSSSIAVTLDEGWSALMLYSAQSLSSTDFESLSFFIHGGSSGGQRLTVTLLSGGEAVGTEVALEPAATGWIEVELAMSELGSPATFDSIAWQDSTGAAQTAFYLDGIVLGGESSPVYDDALAADWQNWSWGSTIDLSNSDPVHSGSASIAVTIEDAWAALFLHSNQTISGTEIARVGFYVHGGAAGGQELSVALLDGDDSAGGAVEIGPLISSWTSVSIPMSELGSPDSFDGIVWQDATGGSLATLFVDDIRLVASSGGGSPPGEGPQLRVDLALERQPISPLIYGMNSVDESLAAELELPIRRWGGNHTTRYNWQYDTSNRASDWYFENIPYDGPDSAVDIFIEENRRNNTATLLTIPIIGWTPKSGERACGFSVAEYGEQQDTDPWYPDCGNGVLADGSTITWNDPEDTSVPITPTFVEDWIDHLTASFGSAPSGVRFYALDNEPMLWNSTHRDVHPDPASYDEVRDRSLQYAAAIKRADPAAEVLGPAVWGWSAYFWSALDCVPEGNCYQNSQDRLAHGDIPFLEWYLQQMAAHEQSSGQRLLDYLDLHFYPLLDGVSSEQLGDSATQSLRLRSTRSFWDRDYIHEATWINQEVFMIGRMKDWVEDNYPGTKLAITEYSWGARAHLNGALAQADILGIFGREGLDLATLWWSPSSDQPAAFAFRIYLNYDGSGGRFGDLSVHATSGDQDRLAIYAAERSDDGALTLVVLNKTAGSLTSSLTIEGLADALIAEVYRYDGSDLDQIVRQADLPLASGVTELDFPANSITLLVAGVAGQTAPNSDFSWIPTIPSAGETVLFSDRSTGVPTSWSWDFGDGSSSTSSGPSHDYADRGTYQVILSVANAVGQTSSSRTLVVTGDDAPAVSDPGAFVYVVPASAKVSGALDTNWSTQLVLNGAGATDAVANLYFLERQRDNQAASGVSLLVPRDTSIRIADVLGDLFDRDGTSGAILVGSDAELLVSSRTFNDLGPQGTFGQFIRGDLLTSAITSGDTARLAQLTSNADFRSNLGLVNVTALPITVLVELSRGDGELLGNRSYTLLPFEYRQVNGIIAGLSADPVDDAFATLTSNTEGAVFFAYASVIDNRTGDPIYMPAQVIGS